MKFKKAIVCVLAAMLATCCFACTPTADTIRVYMPDGAPAVALAKLMHDGYENTEFTVVQSGEIVRARVASGDADLAIIPINAAAALYNGGAKIKMLSVNTHGNLYILSKDGESPDIEFSDLVGKKIAVIMQNDVPGLTFRMLLEKSGTPAATLSAANDAAAEGKVSVYYCETQAAIAAVKQGLVDYAMLPEPAVTNAVKATGGRIVCDIQAQWAELFGGAYPQACLIAKDTVSYKYIQAFLTKLKASDGWAEQNPADAVAAVRAHAETGTESTIPDLTAAMIRGCNIKTAYAYEMKTACGYYFDALAKLKNADDTPVLAAAPDNRFYYDWINELA